ncbi:MAG: metallophosphoesterase [Anaerolineales bacterium]|jgi:putative phosphoesterase
MLIGVISDTHDNIWKMEAAFPHLQEAGAVVHCGDLCSPFMIKRLGAGLKSQAVHIVWGNNEGDRLTIARVAEGFPNVTLQGELAILELGGLRLAVNHYPEIAAELAASRDFDLVCYGHDHTAHLSEVGDCLLLNPGEVMGLNGRSSLALVDSETREVRWIDL